MRIGAGSGIRTHAAHKGHRLSRLTLPTERGSALLDPHMP